MPAYFPTILPDELLASVIARYHVHTHGFSHRQSHMELYGTPHSRTSVNFPRNLRALHKATKQFTGLSLEELVNKTTLYPYYFAFANEATRKAIFNKMVSKQAGQSHSIVLGWAPVFERVKVCPACIKADQATYGEAYWHRSHQLHTAHLCSIHLVPLLLAKTRYFYDYSTPLEPLTETVPTEAYLPAISEKTRQRLLEIARYAERYLHGSSMNDSIHPFEESGRSILLKTHPDGRGCLDLISIERDLVSYFGEQCLELLELPITSGERSAWVKNQFRQNPSPMPTKHILFKLFIEHSAMHMLDNWRPDVYDRLPKEPWACQNPAAAHYGEHVVETVYKVADFKRTGVLGFSCNCGYTFLAETKEWDFRSQPKKIKVQQFGDVFISKARELRTAGHSISEIARRLNVRRNVIYSMLDEDYGTYQRPTPTLALEGRLRKQQEQKATTRSSAHKSSKKVDYAARDAEYVERFVQAAATIRLTTPPVRASRNHILEVSGVGYSQLVRRHFYPRSLAKLHELGETTESIRARRKQWHAQKIDKQLTNPD